MTKNNKKTVKQYLSERPSVHIGMRWDAEGWIFNVQNSHRVYCVFVKRSEVLNVLDKLTVEEEKCSVKSGGGWHLRISGATALFNWAMEQTGGLDEVKGRIEYLCSETEWLAKVEEFKILNGHKANNAGRTGEWVLGGHFEGSVVNPHNDRKNKGESDITLADGSVWEIKTIVLKSRAQLKVQD